MRKQFSNQEILNYAEQLNTIFLNAEKDIDLPIKINFYLQKNIKTFMDTAQEIDRLRLKIGEKYGELNPETESYIFKTVDNLQKAKKDLADLLSIDQVLDIYMISLKELQDTVPNLSVQQMNAILFMIDEKEPKIEFIDME